VGVVRAGCVGPAATPPAASVWCGPERDDGERGPPAPVGIPGVPCADRCRPASAVRTGRSGWVSLPGGAGGALRGGRADGRSESALFRPACGGGDRSRAWVGPGVRDASGDAGREGSGPAAHVRGITGCVLHLSTNNAGAAFQGAPPQLFPATAPGVRGGARTVPTASPAFAGRALAPPAFRRPPAARTAPGVVGDDPRPQTRRSWGDRIA